MLFLDNINHITVMEFPDNMHTVESQLSKLEGGRGVHITE